MEEHEYPGLTREACGTLDHILDREKGTGDILALYCLYLLEATKQDTCNPRLSTMAAAERLRWSEERTSKAKRALKACGLIQDLARRKLTPNSHPVSCTRVF